MCPMRVFLVLFSALLASYLAWRNYYKTEESSILDYTEDETEVFADKAEENSATEVSAKLRSGFWFFVDMATGRYLWQNLRPQAEDVGSR